MHLLAINVLNIKKYFVYKICFVGIEGVGKTWTTQFFAKKFNTHFAMEYGNFYCQEKLGGYFQSNQFLTTKPDFKRIVQGQRKIWKEVIFKSLQQGFCFFDTDHIYTKYFIEKQFSNWIWIDKYIQQQPIDLFIFLKSSQIVKKKQNLIQEGKINEETQILLNYYQFFVSDKLVVVETNDYQEREKKVFQVIQDFLIKNGFSKTNLS